jgi:hypothetical protein
MLAVCGGAAQAAGIDYPRLVYPHLEKQLKLATLIRLGWLCRLALVCRAGFYRWHAAGPASPADLALHDAMQRIALEFPCSGWPRMTAELRRRGWG